MDELSEITQHLLRFSPDALIVIDERGQIRFANETVTEMFGYPLESLIGRSVDALVPERFRAKHGQHIAGFVRAPNNRERLRAVKSPVANCRFLSKPVDTAALVDAIAELTVSTDQDRGAA